MRHADSLTKEHGRTHVSPRYGLCMDVWKIHKWTRQARRVRAPSDRSPSERMRVKRNKWRRSTVLNCTSRHYWKGDSRWSQQKKRVVGTRSHSLILTRFCTRIKSRRLEANASEQRLHELNGVCCCVYIRHTEIAPLCSSWLLWHAYCDEMESARKGVMSWREVQHFPLQAALIYSLTISPQHVSHRHRTGKLLSVYIGIGRKHNTY